MNATIHQLPAALLEELEEPNSPHVTASVLSNDVRDIIANGITPGIQLGWRDVDDLIRIRPQQLTIVTGIPSRGKSEFTDAAAANLAINEKWKTAFFTPENRNISFHMMKMINRLSGRTIGGNWNGFQSISQDEIEVSIKFCDQHFFWLDPDKMSDLSIDGLLSEMRQMVGKYGINQFIIDPWNEIDHKKGRMTEADYVSWATGQLKRFARKYNVHIVLVAHPKIMNKDNRGEYLVPKPYDISGGANWYNKADNMITVHRTVVGQFTHITQIHIMKVKDKFDGRPGLALIEYQPATRRFLNAHDNIKEQYAAQIIAKQS